MLWNRSLIMIDGETKSLWSQLLGKAMRGPLEGTELKILPGLMTDWKTWRKRCPKTTVVTLERTAKSFHNQIYGNPELFVIGMTRGSHARSWSFDQLHKQPVVNETFRGTPLAAVFVRESNTAFLYNRRVEDKTLTFAQKEKLLVDDQTQSTWEATTGLCLDGPLQGKSLRLIPGIISFRKAWKTFHPESEEFTAQ